MSHPFTLLNEGKNKSTPRNNKLYSLQKVHFWTLVLQPSSMMNGFLENTQVCVQYKSALSVWRIFQILSQFHIRLLILRWGLHCDMEQENDQTPPSTVLGKHGPLKSGQSILLPDFHQGFCNAEEYHRVVCYGDFSNFTEVGCRAKHSGNCSTDTWGGEGDRRIS